VVFTALGNGKRKEGYCSNFCGSVTSKKILIFLVSTYGHVPSAAGFALKTKTCWNDGRLKT